MEIIWIDNDGVKVNLEQMLNDLQACTQGYLGWRGGIVRVETDDPAIATILRRLACDRPAPTVSVETSAAVEEPAKPRPPFKPKGDAEPAVKTGLVKVRKALLKLCSRCGKPYLPSGPAAKYCPDCKGKAAVKQAAENKPAPDPEPERKPGELAPNVWRDRETAKELSNYDMRWGVAAGKYPVGRTFENLRTRQVLEVREKPGKEPGEKPGMTLVEVHA